jgi:hypothetical protein
MYKALIAWLVVFLPVTVAVQSAVSPITDIDTGEPFLGGRFMEMGTAYVTSGVWSTIRTEHDSFANGKVFVSIIQSDTVDIFDFPLTTRANSIRKTGQAQFEVSLFFPGGQKCPNYMTPDVNETYSAVISWMIVEVCMCISTTYTYFIVYCIVLYCTLHCIAHCIVLYIYLIHDMYTHPCKHIIYIYVYCLVGWRIYTG